MATMHNNLMAGAFDAPGNGTEFDPKGDYPQCCEAFEDIEKLRGGTTLTLSEGSEVSKVAEYTIKKLANEMEAVIKENGRTGTII